MMPEATPASLLATPPPPLRDREPSTVIWVGRLLPIKGILLALETIARCAPPARLLVVGDGPERQRAQRHARKLGIAERVHFAGSVPWNEVQGHLDSACVLLFTSVRDTFGVQLLEGAARGLPIVGISHQGVGDYVPPEAGRLVPLRTIGEVADSLAAGVDDLLRDEHAWNAASAAARRFAESKSGEQQLDEFIRLYHAVADDGSNDR
jgi:glycosyltransferase involved in cell wall biosynthesis